MNGEDRKRFERIEQILQEHGERLARIEEQNKTQFYTLNEIKQKLFGDGDEGILRDMERHKTYFKILGAVLTMLISILGGILIKIFF